MSFTSGSTVGKYKHKMTKNELANHNHTERIRAYGYDSWPEYVTNSYIFMVDSMSKEYFTPNSTTKSFEIETDSKTYESGDSTPFDILQPSIVVSIWKRIA